MKNFKSFIKEIRAPGKEECPAGMKFDKKLKICVPMRSKTGGRLKWDFEFFVPQTHIKNRKL